MAAHKTSLQTGRGTASEAGETIALEVFRYRPEQESEPTFDRYEVPFRRHWVVLDALNHVKDHLDGTLSFRWSCRMGICGSCGMMVNGEPTLTCSAFLRDYRPGPIRIEPLAHFPVIRDLVINMEDFLEKLIEVKAWLIRPGERSGGQAEEQKSGVELTPGDEYPQTPEQLARYKQFSLCINCMLCYSACPVYGQDPAFIGPAAIALGQRYNLDSRDRGSDERAEALFSYEGIWQCTFVGDCTRVCPKNVDPAGAIQQAKLTAAKKWLRSVLVPWGKRSG
jgi:fumarate reductase iron-sulfur subunit